MDLLIRNVPTLVFDALRAKAHAHGQSVQAQALDVLRRGVDPTGHSLLAWLRTVADPNIDVKAGLAAIREGRDR